MTEPRRPLAGRKLADRRVRVDRPHSPYFRYTGPGQLVAASLRDAIPYREARYEAPCFILVGNESRGLPAEHEPSCDLRVTMPMRGKADSLNAAVAGAVLAYQVLAALEA